MTGVLSQTDIHYLTGVLYLASGSNDDIVILGEKIYDSASESQRDVDIVIAAAGSTAFLAVEVKDKSRKLDVEIVEGICRKLNDMPSITTKAIVSTSGYTAPATRKAHKHQVHCLTLVHGAVPPFPHIDISHLKDMTVCLPHWLQGPNLLLISNSFRPEDRAKLTAKTRVFYPSGSSAPTKLADLQDRVITSALQAAGYEGSSGRKEVKVKLVLTDKPTIQIDRRRIPITEARVTGIVEPQSRDIPLSAACYLEDESGQPFAGLAVVEASGFLIGLAAARGSNALQIILLPPRIRRMRPVRHKLRLQ